jgi:hypothetical protein
VTQTEIRERLCRASSAWHSVNGAHKGVPGRVIRGRGYPGGKRGEARLHGRDFSLIALMICEHRRRLSWIFSSPPF